MNKLHHPSNKAERLRAEKKRSKRLSFAGTDKLVSKFDREGHVKHKVLIETVKEKEADNELREEFLAKT